MSRRATSESSELEDLIASAWDDLDRRGTKAEVLASVMGAAPGELSQYLVAKGVNTAIGAFFRRAGQGGLPQAPEVDDQGTHADSDQLLFEDFGYIVRRHLDSADAHAARAEQWIAACIARYGRAPVAAEATA